MPGIKKTSTFGEAISFDGDDPEYEDKRFCPHCQKTYGKNRQLEDCPLQPGEIPSSDYELIRYCRYCKKKTPVYESPIESELYTDLDVVDNPFDVGKPQIDELKFVNPYQRLKKQQSTFKDKELEAELKKGAELISYEES